MTGTRSTPRRGGLAAVAAILTVSAAARAGDKALAEELFRKAQAVMQRPSPSKDDIHRACQWFKESNDQDQTTNTEVALAACWEKEGKNRSAWGMYSDLASGSGPAASFAKERADALYKQGFLKLRVDAKGLPEDAKVTLDGEPVGSGVLNTELSVDPGEHVVVVKAGGKKDFEKKVQLTAASSPMSVAVELEDAPAVKPPEGGGGAPPPAPQAQPEASPVRTLGVIVGIAGLAAGAGALVSEILAQVFDANSHSGTCKLETGPTGCATTEHNKAVGAQTAAIGLGVAAGALVVTGVVLYFVGAPKKPEPAKATWHLVPSVSAGGAGGFVVGSF